MSDISWLAARPIAHRGYHDLNRSRWENTLSAFQAAAERGFAIECDVHLSADGVPVVFHDEELDRLTGAPGMVNDRTAAELGALRIGGTGDHVPSLDEMLETVAGRVPIVIELKGIEGKDNGLVAAVGARLRPYRGEVAIMSFDHWLVRQFKEHAPGVPGGLTACGIDQASLEKHFSMLAHDIAFSSFFVNELPNAFVRFMREELGRPIITWTVRNRKQVDKTREFADQMTFEGFDPTTGPAA